MIFQLHIYSYIYANIKNLLPYKNPKNRKYKVNCTYKFLGRSFPIQKIPKLNILILGIKKLCTYDIVFHPF
jgi:hypothetical protein